MNAEMNNLTAERFNVAGALVAKLFGRPARAREFSQRAVKRPRHRNHAPRCTAGCCSSRSDSSRRSAPRSCTGSAATSPSRARSRSAPSPPSRSTSAQIYQPLAQLTNARVDVLTALVSFERVFEVLDFPPAIADRPGADDAPAPRGASSSTTCGSGTRRGATYRSSRWRRPAHPVATTERVDPRATSRSHRAGRDGRARRRVRRGQDDDRDARATRVRSGEGRGARRRPRRP